MTANFIPGPVYADETKTFAYGDIVQVRAPNEDHVREGRYGRVVWNNPQRKQDPRTMSIFWVQFDGIERDQIWAAFLEPVPVLTRLAQDDEVLSAHVQTIRNQDAQIKLQRDELERLSNQATDYRKQISKLEPQAATAKTLSNRLTEVAEERASWQVAAYNRSAEVQDAKAEIQRLRGVIDRQDEQLDGKNALEGSEQARLAGEQRLAQVQALLDQQQHTVSVLSQERAIQREEIIRLHNVIDQLEDTAPAEAYRKEFTLPVEDGTLPDDTGLLRALPIHELLALHTQEIVTRHELRMALGLSDDRPRIAGSAE